jgi:hypothetical protein
VFDFKVCKKSLKEHEIFEIEFFTQIRPVRIGDLGIGAKKLKFRKIEL